MAQVKKKKKNKKMAVKKSPTKKTTTNKKKKPINKKKVTKKKNKRKTAKYKIAKRKKIRNRFLIFAMIGLICLFILTVSFGLYIIFTAPKFDENKFYNSESTLIYDKNGTEIAKLGANKREIVNYEDLPQVFIDALIATEDSRFFQHNGFDIARFVKASLGQATGNSDAGGGSTLTMQISKNYLTNVEARGIAGLIRKFTDIYLSIFKIEKDYTKEEIIEFYVNRPYLGASTYGVEEAAQTYFGKSIRDVSLPEAAMIAGMFQSPVRYNPFKYPDRTETRKNIVLNLMHRHGYITTKERDLAKNMHVTNLITGEGDKDSQYIAFIDTVTDEAKKLTGKDPYTTSMLIYSTMDPKVQDVVNDVSNGVTYKFVNDVVQLGVAVTSVKDGSIVAIGGGRNKVGEKTLNFATQIRRHAASSAKPYTVYGPGIEFNKWSTGTPFFDESWSYSNGTSIKNADGNYGGQMTLINALAKSRNIPAIQGFQQLDNKSVVKFMQSMGINVDLLGDGTIVESAAIGGIDGVSPLEQSAAYATFGRGGIYIEPYSFTKIIFRDDNTTFENKKTPTKVMEETTAAMINIVLKRAVDNGLIGNTKIKGTDLCGKTGTSTFDSGFRKKVGLPASSVMDSWVVMYSPDYSTAQWYGYEKMTKEMVSRKEYLVSSAGVRARRSIAQALTNGIMLNNSKFKSTKGIKQVEIELETYPIMLPSANTPANLRSNEWFISGTEPTEVSPRFNTLPNVTNVNHSYNANNGTLTLSWNSVSAPGLSTPEGVNQYYQESFGTFSNGMAKKLDSKVNALITKYTNKRLNYNSSNIGNLVYHIYSKNGGVLTHLGTVTGTSYSLNTFTPNAQTFVIKTAYSIFKAATSSGTTYTVTATNPHVPPVDTPSSEEQPSNVSLIIRHGATIELTAQAGTYTDFSNPINVMDNDQNVTNQANITTTFKNSSGTIISAIDLSIPGNYSVVYNVKYKGKNYEAIRTIIIKP
ncbi:MAG: hypothetical protein GX864_04435 [Mollicutes bacterium]|nr:hypothetical protein [Mollicutes bacterium]